jgi:outer membrane protein TolC
MNTGCERKSNRAGQRRGGPICRFLLVVLLLPSVGCWWDRWTRKEHHDAESDVSPHYYSQSAQPIAAPYAHGVALEIPQSPPPLTPSSNPEAQEKWPMTLREALEIAMRNSEVVRQLRGGVAQAIATRYDPAVAETRVLQELARFDTQLVLNLFWGSDDVQLNSNVAPGGGTVGITTGNPFIFRQDTFGSNAARNSGLPGTGDVLSLRKPLATGGEVTVGFNTDYSLSNVPASNRAFRAGWDSRVSTTIRQPLLFQAGTEVNRAPIVVARLRADQELWQFKRDLADMVRQVEQAYWQLYEAQWQYWAANEAIRANLTVTKVLEEKLKEGTGNASDLAEAQVQLQGFIRQRTFALGGSGLVAGTPVVGILTREQQLRSLLGLAPSDGKRIIAIDEPTIAPINWDWEGLKLEAFTYNPDIQRIKLTIAEQNQIVLIRRNALLPQVDLFARYEVTGLDGKLDSSVAVLTDNDFQSSTAGIQVRVDIGYRRAAAQLEEAMDQLKQARAILRAQAQTVEHTLAQNWRDADQLYLAYKASYAQKTAAKTQVELQTELFKEGKLPIDRLLLAVRAYSDAVRTEQQDKVEYQIALANMEFAKGTIFRYNNIHVHEDAWSPAAYGQAAAQAADRERAIEWYEKPKCPAELESIRAYEEDPLRPIEPAEVPHAPEPPPAAAELAGEVELPLDLPSRKRHEPISDGARIILPASHAPAAGAEPPPPPTVEIILKRP